MSSNYTSFEDEIEAILNDPEGEQSYNLPQAPNYDFDCAVGDDTSNGRRDAVERWMQVGPREISSHQEFSPHLKAEIALNSYRDQTLIDSYARHYAIHRMLIYGWIRSLSNDAYKIFAASSAEGGQRSITLKEEVQKLAQRDRAAVGLRHPFGGFSRKSHIQFEIISVLRLFTLTFITALVAAYASSVYIATYQQHDSGWAELFLQGGLIPFYVATVLIVFIVFMEGFVLYSLSLSRRRIKFVRYELSRYLMMLRAYDAILPGDVLKAHEKECDSAIEELDSVEESVQSRLWQAFAYIVGGGVAAICISSLGGMRWVGPTTLVTGILLWSVCIGLVLQNRWQVQFLNAERDRRMRAAASTNSYQEPNKAGARRAAAF